ncbi:MAG: cache domain-containing protein, partial [Desulfocapsa sp.]|nr:cache domain-containing protein [Desulfocapsa sp.]
MFKQKKRLISFISIFLIMGALLTSVGSYLISITSLKEQITNNELPLTSETIYSEIQRDLLRPIFISSLMASNTFLRDWAKNKEQDPDAIKRYLKEIQDRYNTFSTFFVLEKNHNYYHPDGLVKQVKSDDPRDSWYFRVRDMTEEFEINLDIDLSNNDALTVFINYRVYDYNNNFIGATGVGLTVKSIQQLINQYQEKYSRDVYLIDREGNIQLSNTSTDILQKKETSLKQLMHSQEFLHKITSVDSITIQCKHEGQPISLNTRFIKEFDWYLIVMQNEIRGKSKLVKTML